MWTVWTVLQLIISKKLSLNKQSLSRENFVNIIEKSFQCKIPTTNLNKPSTYKENTEILVSYIIEPLFVPSRKATSCPFDLTLSLSFPLLLQSTTLIRCVNVCLWSREHVSPVTWALYTDFTRKYIHGITHFVANSWANFFFIHLPIYLIESSDLFFINEEWKFF